jgi:hypothetical protein
MDCGAIGSLTTKAKTKGTTTRATSSALRRASLRILKKNRQLRVFFRRALSQVVANFRKSRSLREWLSPWQKRTFG